MNTEKIYGVRPHVGVGVMIMRDGKVLLGRRRGSHGNATFGWCGGHLEFGESLEQRAAREVAEESGLEVDSLRLLCVSNVICYGTHYVDFEFIGEVSAGEPSVMEPDRVEAWGWYDLFHLPAPLFMPVELAIHSFMTGNMYNGSLWCDTSADARELGLIGS
jgi:8-oxo-dGTP diphosphatase